MIKELHLKDMYGNIKKVPFKEGVNLIVGPKGGGKSSLLSALASSEIGFIPKKLKNIFKGSETNPFVLDKVILFSGEEKKFSSMKVETDKQAKIIFDKNVNIISQNDSVKSDLLEAKDIVKKTETIALEYVQNSDSFDKIFEKISEFKQVLVSITDIGRNLIFWENIWKIKDISQTDNLFLKANYSSNELKSEISLARSGLEDRSKAILEFESIIKQTRKDFVESRIISDDFKKSSIKTDEDIFKDLKTMSRGIENENIFISNIDKASTSFEQSYANIVDKLKEENFKKNGIDSFKIKSLEHMNESGKLLKKAYDLFKFLMNDELKIDVNMNHDDELLSYKLKGKISFNEKEIISVLGSLLYSSNTKTEVGKWIEQAVKKGFKEANRTTFNKVIAKIIQSKIMVFAGSMEYENMSPGQKSIFGIKYKMKKSDGKILFIDQPEDNLDNNTIATEVLPMFNDSKAEQIFVVTHNANIGILSNPTNIIVADLENEDSPYTINSINGVKDDPQAHFLEGGTSFLEERWNKMKGGK